VAIEDMTVDNLLLPHTGDIRTPSDKDKIEIHYTALRLRIQRGYGSNIGLRAMIATGSTPTPGVWPITKNCRPAIIVSE